MDGMEKLGKTLAWKLVVKQANGTRQELFVNSHNGDVVLTRYLDKSGELVFSTRAGDFRDVDEFRYPFKLEYMDAGSIVLATENYDEIEITKQIMDTD